MTFSTQKLRACNWYTPEQSRDSFHSWNTCLRQRYAHYETTIYHKKSKKSAPDHIADNCYNLISNSHINGIKKVHGTQNRGSKLITAAGLNARNKRVDKMSEEKTKISVILSSVKIQAIGKASLTRISPTHFFRIFGILTLISR